MADQKLTALTADTSPSDSDIIYGVKDPGGTPLSRKLTWTTVKAFLKTYFDTLYGATTYKVVNSSRSYSAASGTQNIAHGLGKVPKKVRITARTLISDGTDAVVSSAGAYDGTTQGCVWDVESDAAGTHTALVGQDTTAIVRLPGYAGDRQVAVATWDATNIILTWTKTGSPTADTMYLCLEVEG